jgi:hypothetical protein
MFTVGRLYQVTCIALYINVVMTLNKAVRGTVISNLKLKFDVCLLTASGCLVNSGIGTLTLLREHIGAG